MVTKTKHSGVSGIVVVDVARAVEDCFRGGFETLTRVLSGECLYRVWGIDPDQVLPTTPSVEVFETIYHEKFCVHEVYLEIMCIKNAHSVTSARIRPVVKNMFHANSKLKDSFEKAIRDFVPHGAKISFKTFDKIGDLVWVENKDGSLTLKVCYAIIDFTRTAKAA